MIWIVAGALVLIYCAVVYIKLGKVRFSIVPAAMGLGMLLLGLLLVLWPELLIGWLLQLAASIAVLVLAVTELYILFGNLPEVERCTPDVTIVLGCGLKKGDQMTSTLLERLQLAKEKQQGEPIILSGGQTAHETVAEADVMKKWMLENGVQEALLLTEDASHNTRENLENCRALLEKRGDFEELYVRIVTSDFHSARVRKLADEAGYPDYMICSSKTMALIAPMYHLRECLAVLYGTVRRRKKA
jgi:uncharacterized SAM-binding protein YcdF (DUF218 family)